MIESLISIILSPFIYIFAMYHQTCLCLVSPLPKSPTTNQTSVAMRCRYTPPPLCQCIRKHPSSPDFFYFFSEFSRLYNVAIFHIYNLIYNVKQYYLSLYRYSCFALMLSYSDCFYSPLFI